MPPKKLSDRNRGIKNLSEINAFKLNEEYAYSKLKSGQFRAKNCYCTNVALREEKFKVEMPTSRPSLSLGCGNLTKIGGAPVSPASDHDGSRVSCHHQSSSTKRDLPKGQVCVGLNQSSGLVTARSKNHLFHTTSATAVLQGSNHDVNSGSLTKRDIQLCLTCLDSNADGLKTQRILDWLRDCENAKATEYSKFSALTHSRGDKIQNSSYMKWINATDSNEKRNIYPTTSRENVSELFSRHSNNFKRCPNVKSKIPSTTLQLDNTLSGRNSNGNRESFSNYHSEKPPINLSPQLKTVKCLNPLLNNSNPITTLETRQLQLKQKLYEPRISSQDKLQVQANVDKNSSLRFSSKLPVRSNENLLLKSSDRWLNDEISGSKAKIPENLGYDLCHTFREKKKQEYQINKLNSKYLVDYECNGTCDVPCKANIKLILSSFGGTKNQTLLNQKKLKKRYFLVLLHYMLANRLRETKARIFFNQQLLAKSFSKWRSFVNQTKLHTRAPPENNSIRQQIAEQLCRHKLLGDYFWKWYWWTKQQIDNNNTQRLCAPRAKHIRVINLTGDKENPQSPTITTSRQIRTSSPSSDIVPREFWLNCGKSRMNSSARTSPTSSTPTFKSKQNSDAESTPTDQKSKCVKTVTKYKRPEFLKVMERRAVERKIRWAKIMQKKMGCTREFPQEEISKQKKKETTQRRRKDQTAENRKQIENNSNNT